MSHISYIKGNLFTDYDPTKKVILVHGCNAQGMMGSGVAKTFKQMYPKAFEQYVGDVNPKDKVLVEWPTPDKLLGTVSYHKHSDKLLLASAITQENYGRDGQRYVSYDAVNKAFLNITEVAIKEEYEQIVFPLIGGGLGGGDWSVISACINSALTEAMLPPDIQLTCFVTEDWMVESYSTK